MFEPCRSEERVGVRVEAMRACVEDCLSQNSLCALCASALKIYLLYMFYMAKSHFNEGKRWGVVWRLLERRD